MHLGLIVLIDFADLWRGMVFLHAFTFDAAWLPSLGFARGSRFSHLRGATAHPR